MSSKIRTMYDACKGYMMLAKDYPNAFSTKLRWIVRVRQKRSVAALMIFMFIFLPYSGIFLIEPQTPIKVETPVARISAEPPLLNLTWYTLNNDTQKPLSSGDRIAGDQIFVNATWYPAENVNGTEIVVNATAIPNVIKAVGENNSVTINTRALGNNATCTLNVTTWLLNGTAISEVFTNIFFGNFFIPSIQVLSPNGGEIWTGSHNITWMAQDRNYNEELLFEVHLSSDGGESFQLIGSDITDSWLWMNFSGFQNLSTYIIEVRVYDGIYEVFDRSDAAFRAGTVNPTLPTSSTTSDTETITPSEDQLLATFIAAAIIASAFLSVIVYYQAKQLA